MRTLITLFFITCIVSIPVYSFAANHEKASVVDKTISTVKENPAASAGVAACGVAIAFFPPAALICGGALAAGMGVDQANK
jgi:hypothetical protein